MFYIFALERAVEFKNRVLENQLLVTVYEKDASTSGSIFFLSFPFAGILSYARSLVESCPCLHLEKDRMKGLEDYDRLPEIKYVRKMIIISK